MESSHTFRYSFQLNSLGFKGTQLISGTWEALIRLALPNQSHFPDKDFLFAFLLCSRLHQSSHQTLCAFFRHFSRRREEQQLPSPEKSSGSPEKEEETEGGVQGNDDDDDYEGGGDGGNEEEDERESQESGLNVSEELEPFSSLGRKRNK
jgi:hypothetical protein